MNILSLIISLSLTPFTQANKTASPCETTKSTITMNASDLAALTNMNEIATAARFCKNKEIKGCSLEGIVPESIVDRLGLRNGDTLSASNLEPISDLMGALSAFDGIAKGKVSCLIFQRNGKPQAIKYIHADASEAHAH